MADFLNVIIRTKYMREEDVNLFLPHDHPDCKPCSWCREEEVCILNEGTVDMFDLLVRLGAFPSKGAARKNWKKTGKEIPPGWTHLIGIGKFRRELAIWNPIE